MSKVICVEEFCDSLSGDENILILDADGVIFDFFNTFFSFMEKIGYVVDRSKGHHLEDICSFPNGHSIRKDSKSEEEAGKTIADLIDVFFSAYEHASSLPEITDAVKYIKILRCDFKIICLTNMPHKFGTDRTENMDKIGLGFIDTIMNSGSKKHAMEKIRISTSGAIITIDDMATNVIDSIETSSKEINNGIVFDGGHTCHSWDVTYQSSRLAVAKTWMEAHKVAKYYLDRHNVFLGCANELDIDIITFLDKYRDKLSYRDAMSEDSPVKTILSSIGKRYQ